MATQNSRFSKNEAKKTLEWLPVTLAIALLLVGLGIGFYTFSQNQQATLLEEQGVQVNGTVSSVGQTVKNENEKTNQYTISYIYNNIPNTLVISETNLYLTINEDVILIINPEKPSQAILLNDENTGKGNYFWALFLLVAGLVLLKFLIRKQASK